MKSSNQILNLIDWGGGWASRFFYDDSVSRMLNNLPQDFELAETIAKKACGYSALRSFGKYEKLTGHKISANIPTETHKAFEILNLDIVLANKTEYQSSQYWINRLREHLKTDNVTKSINQLSISEPKPPLGNPVKYLENWSFPILSELFPISDNGEKIIFIEDEIASLCWKKWHLSISNKPIWIETPSKSNISSSHFLVWRLIHEAIHLLHLQNYPNAGSLKNPFWLLQMESIAMMAEFRFLELLESESFVPTPKEYHFDKGNVISILLLGFIERSLRLEFELDVYKNNLHPQTWIDKTKKMTGIELSLYDFAFEFHNMQGFMSGYLVGMERYLKSNNELGIFNGSEILFSNETE